ncbi:myoglobin-like [Rhipicephalus sanguineus]|uniref:myoglobin-like n=1 Tax=Rhipicephalus sanguineus TaxID=34632 RepID=UPI0018953288|nr:myoglobin-like [Rhipicephalus sanguineus]
MGLGKSKVDDATGMTEREKQLVLTSWRAFTKDHHDYGVRLFDALFVAHPEYLKMFHKFKGDTIEEVRKDSKFREHGVTIGMQLNNLIEFLDHPDNLIMLVRSNAEFHTKIKGVKPKHFEVFGQVIIDVLKTEHEKLMPPEAVKAWNKLFALMNETIAATFAAGPRSSSRIYSATSARKEWVLAKPSGSVSRTDGGGGHVAKASKSKTERERSPKSLASPSKHHLEKEESTKVLSKENSPKGAKTEESATTEKKEQSSKALKRGQSSVKKEQSVLKKAQSSKMHLQKK